jgi:hypothetical protein
MIKPIQRLCKYSLLIGELIKYTENTHEDLPNLEKSRRLFLEMVK